MKCSREDYSRRLVDKAVEDPSLLAPGTTAIGLDEPVFLFRGKDHFAPLVLDDYGSQLRSAAKDDPQNEYMLSKIAGEVEKWADVMRAYQKEHGSKMPDLPRQPR